MSPRISRRRRRWGDRLFARDRLRNSRFDFVDPPLPDRHQFRGDLVRQFRAPDQQPRQRPALFVRQRHRLFEDLVVAHGESLPRLYRLPQLLRLEVRDHRVDDYVEIPVHHLGEVVHRQADAVVRHAVLREVVRADLFRAVAAADHTFARRRELGLALLALDVVEARLQHLQRLRAVLDLRLLVLAGDDDAGREVGHAHGGVGRVDRLAAGTRGAERVDAQIFLGDLDVDVLDLGQHGHGDRRGVDAPLRLRLRHALHAVHAGLELEARVDLVAFDLQRSVLDAVDRGVVGVGHVDLPALRLGVADVHAHHFRGEERGLVAAGAGADLDEDVLLVVRILRLQQDA